MHFKKREHKKISVSSFLPSVRAASYFIIDYEQDYYFLTFLSLRFITQKGSDAHHLHYDICLSSTIASEELRQCCPDKITDSSQITLSLA